MKKNIFPFILALAAMTACNDSDYELDNIVPTAYQKIMVVKDSGKHTITLSGNTNANDTVTFTVMKTGSKPTLPAQVSVRSLTNEELEQNYIQLENVNYSQLPSDCYTLSNTDVTFSATDRYKKVDVVFDNAKVKARQQQDATATWTVPLIVESKTDSVNVESNEYFIIVK